MKKGEKFDLFLYKTHQLPSLVISDICLANVKELSITNKALFSHHLQQGVFDQVINEIPNDILPITTYDKRLRYYRPQTATTDLQNDSSNESRMQTIMRMMVRADILHNTIQFKIEDELPNIRNIVILAANNKQLECVLSKFMLILEVNNPIVRKIILEELEYILNKELITSVTLVEEIINQIERILIDHEEEVQQIAKNVLGLLIGILAINYLEKNDLEKALEHFHKSAQYGNIKSQYILAKCYMMGRGVQTNFELAAKYFQQAAMNGHIDSQHELGTLYLRLKKPMEAIHWFYKAAAQNFDNSIKMLLNMIDDENIELSLSVLEMFKNLATDQNSSIHNIAIHILTDIAVHENRDIRKAAKKILLELKVELPFLAQIRMGLDDDALDTFIKTRDCAKEELEASMSTTVDSPLLPVEEENICDQLQTSRLSIANLSPCVEPSEQEKLIDLDSLTSIHASGMSYLEEKNYAKAIEQFHKSAQYGFTTSQYELGVCYMFGEGIPKSMSEAMKWFQKAAIKGHALAQHNLGALYLKLKNPLKAIEWFHKAAAQKYSLSIQNLINIIDEDNIELTQVIMETFKDLVINKDSQIGDIALQILIKFAINQNRGIRQSAKRSLLGLKSQLGEGLPSIVEHILQTNDDCFEILRDSLQYDKELQDKAVPFKLINSQNRIQNPDDSRSSSSTSEEKDSFNKNCDKPVENVDTTILEEETKWFTDDEMNKLFKHFFDNNPDIKLVAAINVYQHEGETLLVNLEEIQLQQTLEYSVTSYQLPATSYQLPNTIIIPINLSNMHWAALYIHFNSEDKTSPIINYFDPFGNPMPSILKETLMKVYCNLIETNIMQSPITFQYDGYNCGPWTIAILDSLVHSGMVPEQNFDINDARKRYNEILRSLEMADTQRQDISELTTAIGLQKQITESPKTSPKHSQSQIEDNSSHTEEELASAISKLRLDEKSPKLLLLSKPLTQPLPEPKEKKETKKRFSKSSICLVS